MSKFKIGDRVVRINSEASYDVPIYSKGIVISVDSNDVGVDYNIIGRKLGNFPHNLELEHVFNSPLNQALR